MEVSKNQKKIKETLTQVLAEVWENESFKKKLIESPIEAIVKLTDEKLNLKEGVKMVVVDQSEKDTFYFNIPARPNLNDIELSEEQLEMVAGGDFLGFVGKVLAGPITVATEGFEPYIDGLVAEL